MLLSEKFAAISVGDVLKALVGILTDSLLSSVSVLADVLPDILYELAEAAVGLLGTKIYISIFSDILEAVSFPEFLFLDVVS